MELDNYDNNRGTPTKRTGSNNNVNLENEFESKPNGGDIPEIHTPKPSDATNNIPIEIPNRGAHGEK